MADGKCELCGELLPPGEQMFRYHGYSGECPKPPLIKSTSISSMAVVKYGFRDMRDGDFWIDVTVNDQPYHALGPFGSKPERQRALDDLLNMMRSVGAKDAFAA